MKELKELKNKSSLVFLGKVLGQLISFISVILIGRLLGAEVYGQFVYLISFLMVFTVLPKIGIDNGLVSFLSRSTLNEKQQKSILTFSFLIVGLLCVMSMVIIYVCKDIINQRLLDGVNYGELLVLLIPTILLNSVVDIFRSSIIAKRQIKGITLLESVFNPLTKVMIIVFLVLVFEMKNYYALLIPLYINLVITITYCLIKIKKLNLFGKITKDIENIQVIKFSFPLLFTGIILILMQNVDKYMIGYILSATEVGIYQIAVQFGTISSVALVSVNTIFAPLISNLYHDDRICELGELYKITTKWITILNLMVFGIILVFSKEIMNIAGGEFIIGATALILISLGQVVNSLVGSVGYMVTMTGHPKLVLVSGSIAVILNVILNIVFIPHYGINGAAAATAIALVIRNVLNFTFMYKLLKIQPYDKSYLYLIGTLLFCVLLVMEVSNIIITHGLIKLIICGLLYIVVFSLLIYKFVLSKSELEVFKRNLKHQ